jgi:hypothetical protein
MIWHLNCLAFVMESNWAARNCFETEAQDNEERRIWDAIVIRFRSLSLHYAAGDHAACQRIFNEQLLPAVKAWSRVSSQPVALRKRQLIQLFTVESERLMQSSFRVESISTSAEVVEFSA